MTPRRILAQISREEFVGRDAELREVVRRGSPLASGDGLVIQATPAAGGSELLRQAYDELFMRRGDRVPIYFSFDRGHDTARAVASRFFLSSLQQFIAYRRVDPLLCDAGLTAHDLLELALPSDYELINNFLEAFNRERADDQDFVTFCFSLPRRLASAGRKVFPMVDYVRLAPFTEEMNLGRKLAQEVSRGRNGYAAAGLRRMILTLINHANETAWSHDVIPLEELPEDEARRLIDHLARQFEVQTNEPTRDLILQQLGGRPFFIRKFVEAAHEAKTQLTSFLDCQRLYVDELLGGRIKQHFEQLLRAVAPDAQNRRTLLRVLHETAISETHKSSLWAWKKRLGLAAGDFERLIDALHVCELVNSSGALISVNTESAVWVDYLRAQAAIEVAAEPRAKVVAGMLLETLKRAPQAMARKYRRETALPLPELLAEFNCQSVPAALFHYDRFAVAYKGESIDAIETGLEAETELIKLPQIVYTARGSAYSTGFASAGEDGVVAQGFEAAEYTDENQVVWLAAEIDSKLEVSRELAEESCNRLAALARESGFERARLWLVAREGFLKKASRLLEERKVFSSSRQQVELLAARIKSVPVKGSSAHADEFEMTIPMSEDTELIAAHTVEQIARRLNFRPEAINQIKTALVEACINAAEHSLSPDRKIYQRFVIEDDKLVVTVASRGVVPANLSGQNGDTTVARSSQPAGKDRRGWGLKLIRTLMDEVEFERVDDGTQLRMTKYIR